MVYVNELILTPFSPFDNKCKKKKKINVKNLWKCIFRASRRVSFYVNIFNSSPMQHLRRIHLCQKIGNGWKLSLTVFT